MVGDFDPAAMLKTIEKVFGAWAGKKPAVQPDARSRASRKDGAFISCTFPVRCKRKSSPDAMPSPARHR